MNLSKAQFETLSNFFSDISKGLFLGIALNQLLPSTNPLSAKILVSIIGLSATLISLNLALYFSKEKELL